MLIAMMTAGTATFLFALLRRQEAVPVTLYFQYDRGVSWADTWASKATPRMQFDNIRMVKEKLEVQGRLKESANVSGPIG